MNIILSHSSTHPLNLAAEEFLFSKVGEDFLFLYLNNPSVIIGSNQAVLNEVDMDFCIDNSICIIRRLSGGGAVYHDSGNLNYSFLRDKSDAPLSARFLDPVVSVLHSLGIPVEIGKRKDLWLEGFKISGTASHISRGRELHHGTLLYDTDLDVLQKALNSNQKGIIKKASPSVPSPVKNIRSFIVEREANAPGKELFFEIVSSRLGGYFNQDDQYYFHSDEIEKIKEIEMAKYRQRDWNYRM